MLCIYYMYVVALTLLLNLLVFHFHNMTLLPLDTYYTFVLIVTLSLLVLPLHI